MFWCKRRKENATGYLARKNEEKEESEERKVEWRTGNVQSSSFIAKPGSVVVVTRARNGGSVHVDGPRINVTRFN